jgi:hypothetical protein
MKTVRRISVDVAKIIPDLVGLSFAVVGENMTITLVASDPVVADLDAVQYLDDGPCVHATGHGAVTTYHAGDPLDEVTWSAFARATSANGIASTLSLPMVQDGRVVAGINLHASTVSAFEGHHHALADACSAWERGIVTDADLEFRTRSEAVEAPAGEDPRLGAVDPDPVDAVLRQPVGRSYERTELVALRIGQHAPPEPGLRCRREHTGAQRGEVVDRGAVHVEVDAVLGPVRPVDRVDPQGCRDVGPLSRTGGVLSAASSPLTLAQNRAWRATSTASMHRSCQVTRVTGQSTRKGAPRRRARPDSVHRTVG